MADHFLQFSTYLSIDSQDQRKWLEKHLPVLNPIYDEEEKASSEVWDSLQICAEEAGAEDSFQHLIQAIMDDESMQQWKIEEEVAPKNVWFYAEEGGDPALVLAFVHIFLAHFKRDDIFEITWASYCSKLRIDEFGGGAGFACRKGWDAKGESWWCRAAALALMQG